jgi:hypothetical protein
MRGCRRIVIRRGALNQRASLFSIVIAVNADSHRMVVMVVVVVVPHADSDDMMVVMMVPNPDANTVMMMVVVMSDLHRDLR